MKEPLTVKFVDFWPTFNHNDNKFVDALKTNREVTVLPEDSPDTPDLLFYSRCGQGKHYKYNCPKIYFTGENDFPDFNECDYALSFYHSDCGGRNLRYPLFMLYETEQASNAPFLDDNSALNRGFCSVVLSNTTNCDPRRLSIIEEINSYKTIDSGGRYKNNVGGPVDDKLQFIAKYKFNLALENSLVDGYVTEKILEPFAAATVPIYWGSESAKHDFNPESFININDYDTTDSLLRRIKEIDNNPSEYLRILRTPSHTKETVEQLDHQLQTFLTNIANNPRRHTVPYGEMQTRYHRNSIIVPLSYKRLYMTTSKILVNPTHSLQTLLKKAHLKK